MADEHFCYSQLPRPLTSLIGREEEIQEVSRLLGNDEVRLLTLTGPGGVGKTRLAIAVADRCLDEFEGNAWFVPLASIHDASLVPSTMAHVIEAPLSGSRSVLASIAEHLAGRRTLIVVDNAEHLLDAGPFLAELLAASPRLTLLITSRTVLRISGEHTYAVPPLALLPSTQADATLPAAVRLFVTRARAADASFAPGATTLANVLALCARLDGLPLAIELAAARVAAFPPQIMLRRLDQRLRLLTGGARDQPARLRSMHDAIAWSYDLLPRQEQVLFRRLAVFSGGFTLDAAEAVCPTPEIPGDAIATGIASLLDHSLVQHVPDREGEQRFVLLETLREFAWERLHESDEAAATCQAHAAWALELAEAAAPHTHGPGATAWLDLLMPEHDNLRAALSWALAQRDGELALRLCAALLDFWYFRGHSQEGRRWLAASLAIGADAPDISRARCLFGLGEFVIDAGETASGVAAIQESLGLFRACGDQSGMGLALSQLGIAAGDLGDHATAEQHLTEAHAQFAAIGDRHCLATVITQLGVVAYGRGDHDLAMARFAEALAMGHADDDPLNIATSSWYQALVYCGRGQWALAADAVAEALAMEAALGTMEEIGPSFATIALIAVGLGKWEAGARLFGTAEGMLARQGVAFALPERTEYERASVAMQRRLGAAAYRAARDLGRACTVAAAADDIADVLTAARTAVPGGVDPAAIEKSGLTPRELEVLQLIAAGHVNQQIADALFISVPTVKSHVTAILGKLGLQSRTAAASYAHAQGLVPTPHLSATGTSSES